MAPHLRIRRALLTSGIGAVLFMGCASQVPSVNSVDNASALSAHSAGYIIVASANFLGVFPSDLAWTPAEADVSICEAALASELNKTQKNIGDYYVRLGGIVRDGRRVLIGMAGDKRDKNSELYLRPALPGVAWTWGWGGGDYHFDFEYDCDRKFFTWFGFGGPL